MSELERVYKFIEEFKREKIVMKNLYKDTWLSGSSTYVSPVIIWKNEIEFQWNSERKIFDKFIARTVEKHSDLIERGYFWKSDGSCPSTIIFKLKNAIADQAGAIRQEGAGHENRLRFNAGRNARIKSALFG